MPKTKEPRKVKRIQVRLPEELLAEAADKLAEEGCKTMSDYVRNSLVDKHRRRELEERLNRSLNEQMRYIRGIGKQNYLIMATLNVLLRNVAPPEHSERFVSEVQAEYVRLVNDARR